MRSVDLQPQAPSDTADVKSAASLSCGPRKPIFFVFWLFDERATWLAAFGDGVAPLCRLRMPQSPSEVAACSLGLQIVVLTCDSCPKNVGCAFWQ